MFGVHHTKNTRHRLLSQDSAPISVSAGSGRVPAPYRGGLAACRLAWYTTSRAIWHPDRAESAAYGQKAATQKRLLTMTGDTRRSVDAMWSIVGNVVIQHRTNDQLIGQSCLESALPPDGKDERLDRTLAQLTPRLHPFPGNAASGLPKCSCSTGNVGPLQGPLTWRVPSFSCGLRCPALGCNAPRGQVQALNRVAGAPSHRPGRKRRPIDETSSG